MTASLMTTAALPPSGGQEALGASQNLFEHVAGNAKGMPEGASPHQIGEGLMERLNSFIDRSRSFAERAESLAHGPAQSSFLPPGNTFAAVGGEGPKKVGESQVDQVIHSLGRMFDYSIETQMVVRGATQISGSANTLLKGQ